MSLTPEQHVAIRLEFWDLRARVFDGSVKTLNQVKILFPSLLPENLLPTSEKYKRIWDKCFFSPQLTVV